MSQEQLYDAFISYSHHDLKWGRWLQRRLENYRPPLEQGEKPRPHLRVFRDQTDLAGAELQASLKEALEASGYLIVICSPASAASRWVNEEILCFQRMGRADRILPFIVEGEPGSDVPERECFPEALRGPGSPELLGANIREIGKNKAVLKLLAVLLDIRFNRLVDRYKQRKRRILLTAGLAAFTTVSVVGGLLWRNAEVTRRNKELVYDNYAAILLSFKQNDALEPQDIVHLRSSAEAGNTQAILLLADCCLKGWGMEADPDQAFRWLQKGADLGDASAMAGLTNCYLNGIGTETDEEKAFYWCLKSAEGGDSAGVLNTAVLYEEGAGTEKDEKKALEYYQRSAEMGNEQGIYNLARCYLIGVGTEPDPAQAFFWMESLAQKGNTFGMYNTAMMYQSGYGTEENPEMAYAWYRKAADAGDADAMYQVGWCLENGYGIDSPCLEWYRKAAAAGNADAAEALARLSQEAN